MSSISLIYLVYNEQETLAGVLDEALAYCDKTPREWEIVLVDDGSSDRSAAIAEDYAARESRIRVVTHARNRGMGAAMATGIGAATMRSFVFLSADGQAPIEALDGITPLLADADIVVTTYANARGSRTRDLLSTGLRAFMRLTAGIRFELEGLYLFPTDLAKQIVPDVRADTFFFSFELIDRALGLGVRLATTEMTYRQREAGGSKVANLRRIWRVGREVAHYARRKRRGNPRA